MPSQPTAATRRVDAATSAPATVSAHAQLITLASRSPSRVSFFAGALDVIRAEFGSPYATLYVRSGPEVIEEEAHFGPTDPAFWRPAVRRYLADSLAGGGSRAQPLSAQGAALEVALLGVPLDDETSGTHGAIALVIRGGADAARAGLERLETLAAVMAPAAGLVGRTGDSAAARATGGSPQALARAAGAATVEELAFLITNTVRAKLGCEQVALGIVRRWTVRVLAVSGLSEVHRRGPGVAMLRAAMEECLDAGEPIVVQQDRGWGGERLSGGHRLHRQWRAATGGDAVASFPLRTDGTCVAILSLRRREDEPLRRDQLEEVHKAVEPYAPALLLVGRAQRSLRRHAWDVAWSTVRRSVSPGRWGAKAAVLLALALGAWFVFGKINYEITAPARLTPARQRHVAVPFNGTLAAVHVTPGDRVRTGDLLCAFDVRDLELEQQRLRAELGVLEQEHTRTLAGDKPVEARLVEAKLELTQAQLAIVERRLAQATLRAPFDAVVVAGDLRKQVGNVLAQGTELLTLAPLDGWTLEVDAPEYAAPDLRGGLSGRFAAAARPEESQAFVLHRVAPGAAVRGGRNVFLAEAELHTGVDWLRPGMEGLARVRVGPRPVWWVSLHWALDYLRLHFWL